MVQTCHHSRWTLSYILFSILKLLIFHLFLGAKFTYQSSLSLMIFERYPTVYVMNCSLGSTRYSSTVIFQKQLCPVSTLFIIIINSFDTSNPHHFLGYAVTHNYSSKPNSFLKQRFDRKRTLSRYRLQQISSQLTSRNQSIQEHPSQIACQCSGNRKCSFDP